MSMENFNSEEIKMNEERRKILEAGKQRMLSEMAAAGVDVPFLIQEAFLGYKYRKRQGKLYERDGVIPTKLIKMYYSLNPSEIEFNNLKKSFITKYVKNESKLEGVNDEDIHGKEEIAGLGDMYEYLHSEELDDDFSIYSLKELNKKLFSHAPFPEYAGNYRTDPRYLPGTGLNLCESYSIGRELFYIGKEVDELIECAKEVRELGDVDVLLSYLDRCVELKCKLVWVHPFSDGNGRTIRAFINKLLEDAGLPPIYVKSNERTEYHTAMNLAIGENDYSAIKAFYRYKICDSILELDIDDRVKKLNRELNVRGRQKAKGIQNNE